MATPKYHLTNRSQAEILNQSRDSVSSKDVLDDSDDSAMLRLCDSMARCVTISNEKRDINFFESKPASSLSDLAYNHLIKSTTSRAPSDQDLSQAKFHSDTRIPGSCGFLIPHLVKSEDESSRSQNKLGSAKCSAKLTDLLGAQRTDSDESINSSHDWVIDLSSAIRNPELRKSQDSSEDKNPKQVIQVDNSEEHEEPVTMTRTPCTLDASGILKMNFSYAKKRCSSFGRVLCHAPNQLAGLHIPRRKLFEGHVRRFRFDKPSPDDAYLLHQERKT